MMDFDDGVEIKHYKGWGCALGLAIVGLILLSSTASQQVLVVLGVLLFLAMVALIVAELDYQSTHPEE